MRPHPALEAKLARTVSEPEVGLLPHTQKAVMLQRDVDGALRRYGNSARLSTAFFADFHSIWEKYGIAALEFMAQNHPVRFVEVAAKLSKVVRLEVGAPGGFEKPRSRAELLAKMEERGGAKGRELLERFLGQLDAIEQGAIVTGEEEA
jgi:hypothetical protein